MENTNTTTTVQARIYGAHYYNMPVIEDLGDRVILEGKHYDGRTFPVELPWGDEGDRRDSVAFRPELKPVAGGSNELDELPVHRGAKLKGFAVGRCSRHGGFTFRGEGISLEVAACPVCGARLAPTTSALKSGFRVIDGKDGGELERGILAAMMRPVIAKAVAERVAKARSIAERHNADVERIEARDTGVKVWRGSRYSRGAGVEPVIGWTISTGRYGGGFTYEPGVAESTVYSVERELKVAAKWARKAAKLGVEVPEVPAFELKVVPELPSEREALELELAAERAGKAEAEADRDSVRSDPYPTHTAADLDRYEAMYQRHADDHAARIAELEEELGAAGEDATPAPEREADADTTGAELEAEYPRCPVCGDPVDYCQGHGAELSRLVDKYAPGTDDVEAAVTALLDARELVDDDEQAAAMLEELRVLDADHAGDLERLEAARKVDAGVLTEEEAKAEVERRGLPPVAGGSNELDDVEVPRGYVLRSPGKVSKATLRARPAEHWAAELAGLLELGAGDGWVGPEGAPLGNGGAAGSLLDRGALLIADKVDRWGHRGKDKRYRLTRKGRRIAKRELARRGGLKPVAGGTNELDEVIVELRGRVELERRRELADAERIGAEYRRTGSYITGEAAASCHRRAEGLEHVLDYAGRLAAAGDVRIAELVLRGTLGDKAAARAAKAYSSDGALEAAERASAEADYTDGGGPAPRTSSAPAPALSLFDEDR